MLPPHHVTAITSKGYRHLQYLHRHIHTYKQKKTHTHTHTHNAIWLVKSVGKRNNQYNLILLLHHFLLPLDAFRSPFDEPSPPALSISRGDRT